MERPETNYQTGVKLVEKLPEHYRKRLTLLYQIHKNKEESLNKEKLIEMKETPSRSSVYNWLDDLEESEIVTTEIEDSENDIKLTKEGQEIAEIIKPLFSSKSEIEDEIKRFRSKYLRNPDRKELNEIVGREVKDSTINTLEKYSEPSDKLREEAKQDLQNILKNCLIIIHHDVEPEEILNKSETKDLREAANYYIEHEEILDDFEKVGDGRTYRCPKELENFVKSREMKAPPRPFSLN